MLAIAAHNAAKRWRTRLRRALFVVYLGSTALLLSPATADTMKPNPRLAGLGDSEALDLGSYECETRVPDLNCRTIFDYSRINYDRLHQRFVIFGGGHAATGRTDIDAFDMQTLEWRSLYPSMRCEEVAANDVDPRGFHLNTRHPVARHSYDQNVIAEIDGQAWLLMFSNEGFAGHCHKRNVKITSPAAFPLNDPDVGWTFGPKVNQHWHYAGSAEFDPVSGYVILLSHRSGGLWVYDPVGHTIIATLKGMQPASDSATLTFNPRDRNLYLIDRKSLNVRRITLDRDDWQKTQMTDVATTGEKPPQMRNFAYDSRNHVIGGIADGRFYSLDLDGYEWRTHAITSRSETGARLHSVHSHAIDYDPVNNVFIVMSGKPDRWHTWAYRYRR
ncbi:MAG: hypothetical protein KDJ24_13035 [Gammaproteobacteria bacterium]|nr:hypothetical protein [Gammaproteobacteria bacterium]